MSPTDASTAGSTKFVSSYTDLAAEVRESGLLDRRRGFYAYRITLTVLAFLAVWALVVVLGETWWQLALAVVAAVISAQFGFLGHDGAHRQMFSSPRANDWAARLLAAAGAGLSLHWWRNKHNRHHRAPNQIGVDPDIADGPIAFVPEYAAARTGFRRWFARRQGWLFIPLLTLEGVSLHIASIQGLTARTPIPHRALEIGLIVLRLGLGFAVPFLVMTPVQAVCFIAVALGVFGTLLGGAFAPNHKGMPLVPKDLRVDFLRRQVLMSRNVRGGLFTDVMMGGLNYQIEHHLFPSMPRPNLRKVQPLVRAHCALHGVTYTETSLVASYGIVIRYLNQVGLGHRDPFTCPLVRTYR
ncbi:fatty acid desaturase family protein [Gordonia terrae]|jgi:fatty acid desaturase|uniref:Acyl-CoA desaturase n=2 Tax=Gordonia terrae TaxID=2055 RepID=A0AAD0NXM9_9ACTN|nr:MULTISPECIES: acyl-CoA desaturase [Gordonia]VTR10087.1 Stearoyl-CoA 9-desaturase [Clostridioides difficile]ANY23175.1 delta fatty acid desaturase [Gordonia terrae]AWO83903.1 acyl-CoA desaturase [Gordonia terrae]VTS49019.1 Stearoyl-CoA 9-desaturase [Gordonia terrae]GAB42836.1 putative fatty acid desaturase [Gordonia terrae NBRC 100016]